MPLQEEKLCVDNTVAKRETTNNVDRKNKTDNSNNSNNIARRTGCRADPKVILVQNAILSVHNFFFYSQCSSLDFTGVLLIDHVWVCAANTVDNWVRCAMPPLVVMPSLPGCCLYYSLLSVRCFLPLFCLSEHTIGNSVP